MSITPLDNFTIAAIFAMEALAAYSYSTPPLFPRHRKYQYDEIILMLVTALSLFVGLQMMVDIPGVDIPDIKDIRELFPNLNAPPD